MKYRYRKKGLVREIKDGQGERWKENEREFWRRDKELWIVPAPNGILNAIGSILLQALSL